MFITEPPPPPPPVKKRKNTGFSHQWKKDYFPAS
jgi:hypothetical protein